MPSRKGQAGAGFFTFVALSGDIVTESKRLGRHGMAHGTGKDEE
jgi:hypothetical protein